MEINNIYRGDCKEILKNFPDDSIDLIFADPPYFMQLKKELYRPNQTKVEAVNDDWDKFKDFNHYDQFLNSWLPECQRILKPTGTIWVIGSYHNIFRVGKTMQDLGFWILNDVVWIKHNPLPHFAGVRFNNAHETLIWATKNEKCKKYTFNYHLMKKFNNGKQMRSDWYIPICNGSERIKDSNGKKAHSTQKPEELLKRIILAATEEGHIVLDPFGGTGTTAAVAKKLNRKWVTIEREEKYCELIEERLKHIKEIQKILNQ
jgi:DNA modification methylase